MAKLTPKQKAFAAEYLVDLNAAAAATRAGYSERTARAKGYVLLQMPEIQSLIQDGMTRRAKRLEITQDQVVQELAQIAFFNATRAARVVNNQYGAQVEFTDTADLTEDERAAIAGIEETKHGIKVSSYDKIRALELLGRHLGMFDEKRGADKTEENNLFEVIEQSTKGDLDISEIPEIESPAESCDDVVEQTGI